mmetsp:Transcript_8704/g.14783  ORF Transcript_8704/g.14783 Transcript_8704/m.14783 type:complete len:287 (-) Transcript_8704:94-954(-)
MSAVPVLALGLSPTNRRHSQGRSLQRSLPPGATCPPYYCCVAWQRPLGQPLLPHQEWLRARWRDAPESGACKSPPAGLYPRPQDPRKRFCRYFSGYHLPERVAPAATRGSDPVRAMPPCETKSCAAQSSTCAPFSHLLMPVRCCQSHRGCRPARTRLPHFRRKNAARAGWTVPNLETPWHAWPVLRRESLPPLRECPHRYPPGPQWASRIDHPSALNSWAERLASKNALQSPVLVLAPAGGDFGEAGWYYGYNRRQTVAPCCPGWRFYALNCARVLESVRHRRRFH